MCVQQSGCRPKSAGCLCANSQHHHVLVRTKESMRSRSPDRLIALACLWTLLAFLHFDGFMRCQGVHGTSERQTRLALMLLLVAALTG